MKYTDGLRLNGKPLSMDEKPPQGKGMTINEMRKRDGLKPLNMDRNPPQDSIMNHKEPEKVFTKTSMFKGIIF